MANKFRFKRFQVQRYGVGDLDTDWQYADDSDNLEVAWRKARRVLAKLHKKGDTGKVAWDEHLYVRVIGLHGELEGDYTKFKELKAEAKRTGKGNSYGV